MLDSLLEKPLASSRRVRSAVAAGKVSLAVLISRILGLVREQVFAGLFGAGIYNDAWQVAFRIPNLLRDLFAEGALSSAFVPSFSEYLHRKGKSEAWELANLVLSGLLILVGALTLILFFFSDFLVTLFAAGFAEVPGKVEITSTLIRILAPFLLMIALASVAMGVLNTLNHYFLPALAPALFNVAVILAGFFLVPAFESRGILPIYAMGGGALLGGVLQFAVQVPLMRRNGYRFRLRFQYNHPGVQRMLRLIGPAVVGVSAVQVNVLVNTQLASFLQDNGPVSWLSYAFRIIYLPIGLFGVAVGVVNLKEVSALAASEKWEDLKKTVADSIRLIALLSIPSTIGLMVLAAPIVEVLFERGDFTARDTVHTSWAVMFYSLGLFAYSCIKVYVPTFYALNDTRTPVRISISAVLVNIAVNVLLVLVLPFEYKFVGLAFGTAVSVSVNNVLLAHSFRRKLGPLSSHRIVPNTLKVLAASLVMGVAVYFLNQELQKAWGTMGLIYEITGLTLCLGGGALVYLISCWVLNVPELRDLTRRLSLRR